MNSDNLIYVCILSFAVVFSAAASTEKYSMCDGENNSPAYELTDAIKGCEAELSEFGAVGREKENCSLMLQIIQTPENEAMRKNSKALMLAFSPEINHSSSADLQDAMKNALKVNPNCMDELLWIMFAERVTKAMKIINSH